jgi:serine/threonine-protein kinase RsbW
LTGKSQSIKKNGGKDTVKEVKLSIPMLKDMELAGTKLADLLTKYTKLEHDHIDEIRIAIIEACLNAFTHSKSEDRKVDMIFRIKKDEVEITVEDHGIGFEPTRVKEPRIEANLDSSIKRGWGLKIIRSLMDNVEIQSSEKGTRVIMTKKC